MAWSQTDCHSLFGAYIERSDSGKPSMYCKRIPGKAVYFSMDGEFRVKMTRNFREQRSRGMLLPWMRLRESCTSCSVHKMSA